MIQEDQVILVAPNMKAIRDMDATKEEILCTALSLYLSTCQILTVTSTCPRPCEFQAPGPRCHHHQHQVAKIGRQLQVEDVGGEQNLYIISDLLWEGNG